jgi:hypothetical protein
LNAGCIGARTRCSPAAGTPDRRCDDLKRVGRIVACRPARGASDFM